MKIMKPAFQKKYSYYLALSTFALTALFMIYSAQPWGDNYAYQDISGYIGLIFFMGWAIFPFLGLTLLVYRMPEDKMTIVVPVGVSLICLASFAILIDTVFIHPDAQGGLVFLFLPVYQWIAIGIVIVLNLVVSFLNKRFFKTPQIPSDSGQATL